MPYESDDVYSGVVTALSYESDKIDSLAKNVKLTRQKFADDSEVDFSKAIESAIGR